MSPSERPSCQGGVRRISRFLSQAAPTNDWNQKASKVIHSTKRALKKNETPARYLSNPTEVQSHKQRRYPHHKKAAMGCVCSLFRALTSYHGSHLTPKQVEMQRKQRLLRNRAQTPSRSSSSHSDPPPLAFGKDRVPSIGTQGQRVPPPGLAADDASSPMGERRLGGLVGSPAQPASASRSSAARLADQGRQGSFSRGLSSPFYATSDR